MMKHVDKLDAYDTLLGAVYEAVLDDARWTQVLQAGARLMESASASVLLGGDALSGPLIAHDFGNDPATIALYNRDFSCTNVLVPAMMDVFETGKWFVDDRVATSVAQRQSPYYQVFKKQAGVHSIMASWMVRTPKLSGMISFQRSIGQPDFDSDAEHWARRLFPHLERAARLNLTLLELREQVAMGAAALEQLTWPMWVVDGNGTLKMANRAAEQVNSGDGLLMLSGQLRAQRGVGAALKVALQQAAGRSGPAVGSALQVPRQNGSHWQVTVTPLPAASPFARPWQEPLVLIMAQDPSVRVRAPEKLLREMFRLTGAEARLAQLLAAGLSPGECAERLTVTMPTIRTQLRALYDKTGVNRLTELIAVLQKFAMHVATPAARNSA